MSLGILDRFTPDIGDHFLENFPRRIQYDDYSCVARSTMAVLEYYGVRISLETVLARLGSDEDEGTMMEELPPFFRDLGFRVAVIQGGAKSHIERAIRNGAPVVASVTPRMPHAVAVHGIGRGRVYVADPNPIRRLLAIGSWADFARQWDGSGYAVHWKQGCAARRRGAVVEVVEE